MRPRLGLVVCVLIVGVAVIAALEPRLHHEFPSMIDDWIAIRDSPEQVREVVRLGSPEGQRYRPGLIAWSALQWHTLGAPESSTGPQLWGLFRVAALVVGVTLLTALVVAGVGGARPRPDVRWLLVVGVPLVALTAPSLAIDVARYGPQEPLMVGCMALGAVLLVRALDGLLGPRAANGWTIAAAAAGLVVWAFGVFQKETSICVLVLAPFLIPNLRAQRPRWQALSRPERAGVVAVAAGALLPFVPMVGRTIELSLADERFYGEIAAQKSFAQRLSDQLGQAAEVLHSHVPTAIAVAAIVLLAVTLVRNRIDWLSAGFVAVALAFVLFAAEAGVVASRYYLPAIVLTALAVARMAIPLGRSAIVVAGVAFIAFGCYQAYDAHGWVQWWVDGERDRETLVREAAAREAGGCRVDVTGLNVELVQALPVLVPLANEPPRDCAPGEHFVVVIDPGGPGTETPPDDPVLASCRPASEPDWGSHIGKIVRCTA